MEVADIAIVKEYIFGKALTTIEVHPLGGNEVEKDKSGKLASAAREMASWRVGAERQHHNWT